MRKLLLLLPILFICSNLYAESYQIVQGEVLTLHRAVPEGDVTLECFGKKWPVIRERDGRVWAWIGVDLKTKPATYPIIWRSGSWHEKEQVIVSKGEFKISHITVDKKMASFDRESLARIRADQKSLKNSYVTDVDATPFIHITTMPVEGIESSPFGAQRYVNNKPRSPHSGIDIAAPEGSAIITPLAGKVLVSSSMYLNGNTVVIGHGHGLVSVFSHMKIALVREGEWIKQGEKIGEVGMTGRATGPHLHWGIRFNRARINPHSIIRIEE